MDDATREAYDAQLGALIKEHNARRFERDTPETVKLYAHPQVIDYSTERFGRSLRTTIHVKQEVPRCDRRLFNWAHTSRAFFASPSNWEDKLERLRVWLRDLPIFRATRVLELGDEVNRAKAEAAGEEG